MLRGSARWGLVGMLRVWTVVVGLSRGACGRVRGFRLGIRGL
jgi:hypothetical protein